MTEEQAQVESKNSLENQDKPIRDQNISVENQKRKEASWLHTILWIISMMMIVNVVVGIIF